MSTLHQPVLLDEVLGSLDPRPGREILDLTLGGGSYAAACLERGARVIGLDRDPLAVARCQQRLASFGERFTAMVRGFAEFGEALDELDTPTVHGICMDLGLSSDQLDDPTRGFGFRFDGDLDLRFDPRSGEPAWRQLEEADVRTIERWLREWGEVRRPRRLARRLHELAHAGRLRTTGQLRAAVESTLPRGVRPEPELARVFQALRIEINDEMTQLDAALDQVADRLAVGGRFVAVSYHSLEDRRVKRLLRRESGADRGSRHLPATERPVRLKNLTPRAVRPSAAEIHTNPRARSARLRAGERRA
jgi:16S rRNA (cytosine1402-N4)-methyltransferase